MGIADYDNNEPVPDPRPSDYWTVRRRLEHVDAIQALDALQARIERVEALIEKWRDQARLGSWGLTKLSVESRVELLRADEVEAALSAPTEEKSDD